MMSLSFFKDRAFLREMLVIALPISFQQLINASLNMIDVIMVGQLGEASIAALGLSNQVFFVFILFRKTLVLMFLRLNKAFVQF